MSQNTVKILLQKIKPEYSFALQHFPLFQIDSGISISKSERNKMFEYLNRYGYLILQEKFCFDPMQSLQGIGRYFGGIIYHNLSDHSGVHPIRYIPGYPEYANTTTLELALHTDGSFELNSPKLILTYCEIPDIKGGNTRIAFSRDVYLFIKKMCPEMLDGLFLPNAFSIKRDDRQANKPVFSINEKNFLHMHYRSGNDISVQIHPQAVQGFCAIEQFLSNPLHYIEFRLQRGQILIIDNTRVLHGRTSFDRNSSRKMHGLWCDGISPFSSMFNIGFQSI